MNYVTVEDIKIKDEDFEVVDNSIYEEENTLGIIPLKDQDEFENSENKPLKIQKLQERKPKPHGCSQCDERFRKKSNLLRHVQRVHEGKVYEGKMEQKKIYKCSICSSSFTRNMILTNHMTTVHNIDY